MLGLRKPGAPPAIVAHRGASGIAPENTFAAFELAVEQGADAIECDVHLSADGVPIVIHDHRLERTTSGVGPVRHQYAEQLMKLDAGAWFGDSFRGERLPRLDELLAWCRGRYQLSIEIKNGPIYYPGIEEIVTRLVEAHDMVECASIISFDHRALSRLRRHSSGVRTGAIYAALLVDGPAVARQCGASALLPHVGFATRDMVDEAHAEGLAVSVWTVNEREELELALSSGVDAVATDHPARVRAWVA